MNARPHRHGFTLIELIVAIVLLGIIGSAFGMFILPAFQSYQAVARRAELVDSAESALRRMARDIRISLPNSVRVTNTGTGFALEMIPTIDGGRYCIDLTGNCTTVGASAVLDFTGVDTDFDILGCFRNAALTGTPLTSTAYRLVIGNAGNEVYSGGAPTVITPSGGSITFSTVNGGGAGSGACGTSSTGNTFHRHHIAIAGGFAFGTPSTRERVFVIETAAAPVSYVCDTSTTPGTLKRYVNYAFDTVQPNPPGVAGRLVANNLTACAVSTSTTVVQTVSLVTVDLSVSNSGETIRLIQQVQLDNSI
ncbi:MAG: type II secretion system protein [Pseudomonadota bacterium]